MRLAQILLVVTKNRQAMMLLAATRVNSMTANSVIKMTCKILSPLFTVIAVWAAVVDYSVLNIGTVAAQGTQVRVLKYDPHKLPQGHEYFDLRRGIANAHRKFVVEKTGRVVFLGGSITAGGAWRQHICDYLTRKFPDTKFEFLNAGIGSLGSVPHAFRLERDVLAKGSVDLLFLEAAVNDTSNTGDRPDHMLRGMEGVVRHMLTVNGSTDIIQLHFVMPEHMADYNAGRTPESIAAHEKVAMRYGNPSLNLSREVTDRINAGEFTWDDDFKNLHPSPFGHQLYANSIARMLDKAFAIPVTPAVIERELPAIIDPYSYFRGRFGDIATARLLKGFRIDPSWSPGTKQGVRAGFVNVPALVGSQVGDEFEFSFTGTGCGLFITSGPDSCRIEYSVDEGDYRQLDTFTRWSPSLHLPWVLILDDRLPIGQHRVKVRIAGGTENRTALRVFHLLFN